MEKFKGDLNKLNLPEGLDEKDLELIIKQCELQSATSDEEILGFGNAYFLAKKLALDSEKLTSLTGEDVYRLIKNLGSIVDKRNLKGFRNVSVRFANFSMGLNPAKIEQAIGSLAYAYADVMRNGFFTDSADRTPLLPIDFYREFEIIHPFIDGNGRVGDLLWKIAMTRWDGKWPKTLPPDIFNSNN